MNNYYLKLFGVLTTLCMIVVFIQSFLVSQAHSITIFSNEGPFASIHRLSESANNLRWMAYTQRLGSGLLILMVAILSVWSWKALRKQLIWRGTINV
ncbi:hypothetical protein [Evansella vedderi]|uniref:hypothetical protein n=1 Tax=Evansella vedderi TaxID=38282 RepID=UPI0027D805C5|nr:hypothetical protein [Evansella vedderi]